METTPTTSSNISNNDNTTIFKALQLNVWLDATKVSGGLPLIAQTILDSGADIVSLNEVKNFWGQDFVKNLKNELQRRQHQPAVKWYGNFPGNPRKMSLHADTAIISKFPIVDEQVVYRTMENSIVRSLIQIGCHHHPHDQRQLLAVYSVHLEYRAYSCYLPRGYNSHSQNFPGWSPILHTPDLKKPPQSSTPSYIMQSAASCIYQSVIAWMDTEPPSIEHNQPVTDPEIIHRDNMSSGRPEAIQRLLDDVLLFETNRNHHVSAALVMGDFNEPSALDWTEDTKNSACHNGVVYKWETTKRLLDNGFLDSYRDLYPNPVIHPGYTWPAAARGVDNVSAIPTGWLCHSDERDRIDFIFYKNHHHHHQQQTGKRQHSMLVKPVDAWIVGTPEMMVGNRLVDDKYGDVDTNVPLNINPRKMIQDKCSLEVGSPWPSDHRGVLTVFETTTSSR